MSDPPLLRLWSLTADASVEDDSETGSVLVNTRWGELLLDDVDEFVMECLRRMAMGAVSLHNVTSTQADRTSTGDADDPLGRLNQVLDRVSGSVVHSLQLPDRVRPLLSVAPVRASAAFQPQPIPATRSVRLSRFSVLRPREHGMALESPLADFEVMLEDPSASVLASCLASPTTLAELARRTDLSMAAVAEVVAFLAAAGLVLTADSDGRFAEDHDALLRDWTWYELLFHVRSRSTQQREESVAHAEEVLPPVTGPVPPGTTVPLYRPSSEQLTTFDARLTDLLEARDRFPPLAGGEISADQIGELLFRTARIRSVEPWPLAPNKGLVSSQRPYYSIGYLYELELYLTVNRCPDLARGIYHYDPYAHALTLIDETAAHTATMLELGMVAAGRTRRPAAMITITARRERTSWLFGGASYSIALTHVGALQQTIHLCARALGLSAHAVPVDASDTVDQLLGLRWPGEVGVGECVLNSLT